MSVRDGLLHLVQRSSWLRGTTAKLVLSTGRVALATGTASVLLVAIALISARVVGPNNRGAIVLVATTGTYLMLVTSLGTPISVRVMLGAGQRRVVLGHYLGLGLILTVVQIVLTTVLVRILLMFSGVPVPIEAAALAGLFGGGLLLAYLLVHGLFGLGLNEQAAVVQIGGAAAQFLLVVALGVTGITSPWPYVGAMLAGTIGQVVASLAFLGSNQALVRPSFSVSGWRSLIVGGIPGIGLSLGQAAVLRIDRILIGLILSASAVGVYSVAASAADLVSLVPTALSQVIFQRIASETIDGSTVKRARSISLLVGMGVALILYFLAPVGIDRLIGPRFTDATAPLRVLLLAAVLLSSYQIDAYALAARGRVWQAGIATVLGFAIIFVADLIFISSYGLLGAAWASVMGYGAMAAISRFMFRRSMRTLSALHPVSDA